MDFKTECCAGKQCELLIVGRRGGFEGRAFPTSSKMMWLKVMPQYRGCISFVVRDDIVIVELSSYQIVDVHASPHRRSLARFRGDPILR
jgi:hypothetical protein